MNTIWKFELGLDVGEQKIEMPKGAKILHVAGQYFEDYGLGKHTSRIGTFPTFWALVDPGAEKCERLIKTYYTGDPAPGLLHGEWMFAKYIGTAICGPIVYHVFDCGEVGAP